MAKKTEIDAALLDELLKDQDPKKVLTSEVRTCATPASA